MMGSGRLAAVVGGIRRRAENIVSLLLGVMFLAFIAQIVFRYVFNWPVGWSSELSVIAWLYMVLLGSAFWLKESEEIRFDLMTDRLGPRARRAVTLVLAIAVVVLFGMSLPATIRYVAFMKVESSSYLKIRLDILYAVYALFVVTVIVRYAHAAWRALRGEVAEDVDITKRGYGL
jgi:C4-dicarboxylate transporter, DctQ subunit